MNPMHVLVVEDEPDGQEVVANILGYFNIDVTAVDNAQDALDLLDQGHFDCAIIDLYLPNIDGWQLLREIRNNSTVRDMPCIAITAYHTSAVRQEAINAGFDAYFSKPLEQTTFVRGVMGVVSSNA